MLRALARRLVLVPFFLIGTIAGAAEVELRLLDETGQATSAQLSVIDDKGRAHIATNALPVGRWPGSVTQNVDIIVDFPAAVPARPSSRREKTCSEDEARGHAQDLQPMMPSSRIF
ncbi:MAG: hypothetical protein P8R42_01890 [Candidatus Binatia bacterium]|nr:hypothetical protein [Candidatus Binatia bacterium]